MITRSLHAPPPVTRTARKPLQLRTRPTGLQPVEAIAQAVLATPGVEGLLAGKDHVITYLPTRQVRGVRQAAHGFEIHVVLVHDCSLLLTVEAVRAAVQVLAPGRVDVTVESVARRRAVAR